MPKQVPALQKMQALNLMRKKVSQRKIAEITGLSRPFLRKLSGQVGHKFPRNGIEIRGDLCMCANCGVFIRKPPSRVKRAGHNFCSVTCKGEFFRGEKNPAWKDGKYSSTFSKWIMNQSDYDDWRDQVLERDNYTCQITGRYDVPLQAHHVKPKAEYQDIALDVDNGLTVSEEAHQLIHKMIREGHSYEDAVEEAKKAYELKENKDDE